MSYLGRGMPFFLSPWCDRSSMAEHKKCPGCDCVCHPVELEPMTQYVGGQSWKWTKHMSKEDAFVAGFGLGFFIPCMLFILHIWK